MKQQLSYKSEELKAEAVRLGFSACGVARAEAVDVRDEVAMHRWLVAGGNADMAYMGNNTDKRLDPRLLLPSARSVIVVALNYYPQELIAPSHPQIAYYAYGKDYHDVMRRLLGELSCSLGIFDVRDKNAEREGKAEGLICCDTVPVLDRYWAWMSGIGWIGKNTNLIIPKAGSYFFLGEIITSLEFDCYDQPMEEHCGQCRKCLDACPTGALEDPYSINAGKCMSYLTIEHRGEIPPEYAAKMGNCIYGCDRCQQACPHNRFARPTTIEEFRPSPDLLAMTTTDWVNLSRDDYQRLFRNSAIKRAKYEGLKRNIHVALESSDL